MPELDDRIRALVSAAVADAPPAPDIDIAPARVTERRPDWLRRGAIALAALLAAGGGYAVLQPASESDVDTTSPTTVPATPAPSDLVVATAGPNGVREIVNDNERVVTTEPMAMALALDNGDVIAQRHHYSYDERVSGKAVPPTLITTDGETGLLFDPKAVKGPVDIHDFSIVEGRRLLLYSVYEPKIDGPEGAARAWNEMLYTFDLDSGSITPLGQIGGWESAASRMHLATTGLIVGTEHGLEGNGTLFTTAIPGSPAASRPLPKGDRDGTNYVIDARGTHLYWVVTATDADFTFVASAALTALGYESEIVLDLPRNGISAASTFIDVVREDVVVVSYYQPFDTDGPERGAVRVEGDAVNDLGGYTATVGPNG